MFRDAIVPAVRWRLDRSFDNYLRCPCAVAIPLTAFRYEAQAHDIVPPMRLSGSIFGKGSITRSSSVGMGVVLPAASCVGTKHAPVATPFRVGGPVAAEMEPTAP